MNVIVEKIHTNHNKVRTNFIEGNLHTSLEVGSYIRVTGQSLTDPEATRLFTTSRLVEVTENKDGTYTCKTYSGSIYKVTYVQ